MNARLTFVILGLIASGIPSTLLAQERTVTLVKSEAVKLEEASDEIFYKLDGTEMRRTDLGDEDYWRHGGDRPKTQNVGRAVLKGGPGSSVTVEMIEQDGFADPNEHIGMVKISVEADGTKFIPVRDCKYLGRDNDGNHVVELTGDGAHYKLFFQVAVIE